MAAADYLGQLKSRLGITDTNDDAALLGLLQSTLTMIQEYTGRDYAATTATRTFTAESGGRCEIDDLLTVTTLKTDGQGDLTYGDTWSTSDYQLEPPNETPKTHIILHPTGNEAFPTHRNGVQIAGSFGYATTPPEPIREAVLLESSRAWMQSQSPSGIVASPELGTLLVVPAMHPSTMLNLQPYVKMDLRA